MDQQEQIKLTANEISSLWIRKDVNLQAPRLFSDKLYLLYLLNTSYLNLDLYSKALANAERGDIITYFSECIKRIIDVHQRMMELAKNKGIYIRSPHIPKPDRVEFVKKQNFLSGWFGTQRPLNVMKITNIVANAKRNALGHALMTAFYQVASSKGVKKYFERGKEIAKKHMEIFRGLLVENDLSEATLFYTSEISDSTESPFSEKLMMYLTTGLISSSIAQYGYSMSQSLRHNLGVSYTRLIAEIANYADDGANIMIDFGWMEQPPMAPDRENLSK